MSRPRPSSWLVVASLTVALCGLSRGAAAGDSPPPPPAFEAPPPVAPPAAAPPPPPIVEIAPVAPAAPPPAPPPVAQPAAPPIAQPPVAEPTPPPVAQPARPQPIPPAKPKPAAPSPPPSKPADCPPWICKDADPFGDDRIGARPTAGAHAAAAVDGKRTVGKKPRRFIEGELANVGAIGLVPWENQVGVVLGIERVGIAYYAAITPQINYNAAVYDRPLDMSFAVPVRLQLLDTRPATQGDDRGWSHVGRIRKQDWDEVSDFAQIIRNITFGGKEGHVYMDVNAFKASSLGHGAVMRRYNPNLNLNSRQVSGELDAFGDYGGGEIFVNNVTRPNVLGGIVFAKPLSLIDRDSYVMRSFSLGATVVADIDAPLRNKLDYDDLDDNGRRDTQLAIDQKSFRPLYASTSVIAYGLDAEVKLVDSPVADWKTYLDYSKLASGLPTDDPKALNFGDIPTKYRDSGGLTWGHLLRLNLGEDTVHALRLRAEVRRYDQNYLPGYFDVMYEIQRVQYSLARRSNLTGAQLQQQLVNGTKLQQVLGRAEGTSKVFGLYFEASWKIADSFAIAMAMETNDSTPDNNFFVHLEVPTYRNFQFLATLHRRSAVTAGDLFKASSSTNDILIVKGRYRLSDRFHINMEAITPYGIGPDSLFQNTVDFNVNAEFGFGYGSKR